MPDPVTEQRKGRGPRRVAGWSAGKRRAGRPRHPAQRSAPAVLGAGSGGSSQPWDSDWCRAEGSVWVLLLRTLGGCGGP